jgi:hypothetical protein
MRATIASLKLENAKLREELVNRATVVRKFLRLISTEGVKLDPQEYRCIRDIVAAEEMPP